MEKPKSKKKSNSHRRHHQQHQEPTNPGQFSFDITKVAVAQICKSVGFRRSQVSALKTLTVVATKYIETLAKSAATFSNTANRTQSNLLDFTNALHDTSLQMGFNGAATLHEDSSCLLKSVLLDDLSRFVISTDEIPFAKPIERPKRSEREEAKACTGSLQRGGHVPEWLPGFPADVGGDNEQCNGRVNGETLWENSILVHQRDGFEGKRDCGIKGGKIVKGRTAVKFSINGGGETKTKTKRVHLNNLFSQSEDEEEKEAEYKRPVTVTSMENQILVYKRRKTKL